MHRKRKLPWPKFTYFNSNKYLTTPGKVSLLLFIHSLIWLPLGIFAIKSVSLTKPVIFVAVILFLFGTICILGSFYSLFCFIEESMLKKAEKRLKEENHKIWLANRKK